MRSLSSRERRLLRSAAADLIWYSTSTAACLSVGLESSTSTVPAVTCSPGLTNLCSTRPSTGAAICLMSSGMSVPTPCTCRSICPRLTVSVKSTERETRGGAGFRRDSPYVMSATASTHRTAYAVSFSRRRFFRWGRFTSITHFTCARPFNKPRTTRVTLSNAPVFQRFFAGREESRALPVSVSEKRNPKIENPAADIIIWRQVLVERLTSDVRMWSEVRSMSKTVSPDVTADESGEYEESINQMLAEMRQANEKMDRDQEEIERLKAETREILLRLKAA